MAYSNNIQLFLDLKDTRRACELGGVFEKWASVYKNFLFDVKDLFTTNSGTLSPDDLVWFSSNYDFLTTTLPSFTFTIEGNTFSIVTGKFYAFSKGEAQLFYKQVVEAGYPSTIVTVQTLSTYMTSGNGQNTVFSAG